MTDTFDFIIVGGGTAGSLLAHRLSHAPAKPSVLLVEAGSKPEGQWLREPYHRYTPAALRPDLDYGYSSIPQRELNGRTIPYTRGKGLDGSSILNFAVFLHGSAEDYNRWAELVGDDNWNWEHTKKSFQAIEDFDFSAASQYSHLAKPNPENHSQDGTVKVELPQKLEPGVRESMEALIKSGEKLNLDTNSGDPIGISIFPLSYSKDGRTTSATAHLLNPPSNLTIWTGAPSHRLVFDGLRVSGVETADGRSASSRKEVIIAGGAIDTPKLLLLNGIGPAQELSDMGIAVVKDLPGVGKQLNDHVMTFMTFETDTEHNDRHVFETDSRRMTEAEEQYKKDRTGNLALYNSSNWGGFLKLPGLEQLPEYKALSKGVQQYLSKDKVPSYELGGNLPQWPPGHKLPEGSSYFTFIAFLMNPQSRGSVTLKSRNPEEKPVIDLAYLEHPYDRKIFREAIRTSFTKIQEAPDLKKHIRSTILGPQSLSDEDVDAFMRESATTVWHANGTAMMGKEDNPLAVVDSSFRVYGIDGLRVADLSVCPLTTNNHTQATAYLVGQKAAEKLISEYKLDAKL